MLEREVSTQETAPYRLSSHCRFITGAKRAAIYDLEKSNVYSLNEIAREIINGSPDRFGFWKKLVERGLIETSPCISLSDIELKMPQVGLEFMWLELIGRCNERCFHY